MEFVRSMDQLHNDKIEFMMIDNHSDDGTAEYLMGLSSPFRCHVNDQNTGMVKAFNQGAFLTVSDILVFMHNDVFLHHGTWPDVLRQFFSENSDAGVVGLYGARCLRGDGSFMGRSIVHAKLEGGSLRQQQAAVAAVDGLFMAVRRTLFDSVDGFDEGFIMHFYDKDLSLKSHAAGYRNFVLNIPFVHRGAGTRSSVAAGDDTRIRGAMKRIFLEKWHNILPLDIRPPGERVIEWVRKYV